MKKKWNGRNNEKLNVTNSFSANDDYRKCMKTVDLAMFKQPSSSPVRQIY